MKYKTTLSFALTLALAMSACSTIEPKLNINVESGKEFSAPNSGKERMPHEKWWQEFKADELNALIEKGLKESPDMLVAFERITQSQIAKNTASAPLLPSLDLRSGTSLSQRNTSSANTTTAKATNSELSMSYELDVWGRIAAGVRLADANLAISKYDYETLKLALIGTIAQNYFLYQSAHQRVAIARENLQIAQKVLLVMEARLRYGAINALDVSRQKTTLYNQEINLINLENQRLGYKNAIAILVGVAPNSFTLQGKTLESISSPVVSAGLPSELLLRRPDIAASQAALSASKAAIQLTDAARYPSFSLSGAAGSSSATLLSFTDPASTLSAGLGMHYNIFDDGRLTNARLTEESKANAALQNYKKSLLTAFKEVEDALNAINFAEQNLLLATKTLKESAYTFELATIQYKNGRIDFTAFLDVQQIYFSTKERLILAKQERLNASVTLYKALGGGFTSES